MKPLRYFVPADSTLCSINALRYATALAKASGGSIDLLHITDASEIEETDNPVVAERRLSLLEKKAVEQLQLLTKITRQSGVALNSKQCAIGNVKKLLVDYSKRFNTDLMIIGKSNHNAFAPYLSSLIKEIMCPVMVIPESIYPEIPSTAILTSDLRLVPEAQLNSFFEIMEHINHHFSVLDIYQKKAVFGAWLKSRNDISKSGKTKRESIQLFVAANQADMLCTPKPMHGFKNLFHNSMTRETMNLEIPVYYLG